MVKSIGNRIYDKMLSQDSTHCVSAAISSCPVQSGASGIRRLQRQTAYQIRSDAHSEGLKAPHTVQGAWAASLQERVDYLQRSVGSAPRYDAP